MLQTIEVEIDAKGHIHPLEQLPLPLKGKARALLTILPTVRQQADKASQQTPAYGVLSSSCSVSLEDMEASVRTRGSRI